MIARGKLGAIGYPCPIAGQMTESQVAELVEKHKPEIVETIVAKGHGNTGPPAFSHEYRSIEIHMSEMRKREQGDTALPGYSRACRGPSSVRESEARI